MKTKFQVRRSKIQGRGLFAFANLPARKKLGEISGALVRLPQARIRAAGRARIYLVELSRNLALDCSRGNDFKYLNHSCRPNCYLRIFRLRVEVYALENIRTGSELTVDYGTTPHENGMSCLCCLKQCRAKI